MSAISKAIAVTLIVMAVVATGYTGYFAKEYSDSLAALADFTAYAEFDPENVELYENQSYIEVIISMQNPSNIEIKAYEIDLALFLQNSTTGKFTRIGKPLIFYSDYNPIVVKPNSDGKARFYLHIEDPQDYAWNIEKMHEKNESIRVDPYMEIRYRVANYDFTNMYAWGIWHWTCKECGRGPFD